MITSPLPIHLHSNPKKPNEGFAVTFPYSKEAVNQIHTVLGLMWDKPTKSWISEGPEVLLDMERFGVKPVWLSREARDIAENFRQQLWDVLKARAEPIYDSEYGYQNQGTKFLVLNKRALLGDDMGLGKTKQALDALVQVGKKCLILAPKTLTYNWQKELDKWHPELSYGVVPDAQHSVQKMDRKKFWANPPDIVIANYEKLNSDGWPYDQDWDVIICDEATRLKNSTTVTWKAVHKISKRSQYAWLLTGTPLEIRLMELYNIFALIRPSVLGVYPRFREQHCLTDWGGNVVGVQNLDLLRERIGYWMLRRTKEEVLPNLPPKLYNNHFVKMSVPEQKEYQQLLNDFKGSLDIWQPNFGDPLTKTIRLRQYCCSPVILGLGRKGSKYEELVEIIKGHDGHVVVFTWFEEAASLLASWLAKDVGHNPRAYISGKVSAKDGERIKRAREFDEGKLGKVFLSTDAGREGIDLVSADMVIHYDQGMWNPQKQHQREDRAHRIGQKNVLNVVNLMYMDSIDYGMYLVNEEREQLFDDVIEGAERAMIKKLNPSRLLRLAEGKSGMRSQE